MNKKEFINELSKRLKYDTEICIKINEVLEANFLIGKHKKEKIINDLIEKINIDKNRADEIYCIVSEILTTNIKNKLFHPFGSK